MRIRRNFKDWEKDFIYLAYPQFDNLNIANILNRTKEVIQTYASRKKYKKEDKVVLGQKFGNLIVVKRTENFWECLCDCGNRSKCSTNTLTSGHSKSCGCERLKAISTGSKNITGTWYGNVKRNAKRRGFDFNVSHEFLDNLLEKQNHKCVLSGMSIQIDTRRSSKEYYKNTTASLDRIDNNKGYEEDNVQFLHKSINYMKWTHDQECFIDLCRLVAYNEL